MARVKPVLPLKSELPLIKAGNVELINKYYTANYELIGKKARFYSKNFGRLQDWRDFTHDVYINFSMLDLTCDAYFYVSLKRLFYWSRCGGRSSANQLERKNAIQQEIYNLDAPVKNAPKDWRDMTIGEAVESDFDMFREICPRPDFSNEVFNLLLPFCSKANKPIFELKYWVDYSCKELAQMLGKKSVTLGYLYNFRKHASEIKDGLQKMGFYEVV